MLRRYRGGVDAAREATVMQFVARHGFPVPHVHRAAGGDLEMERLHGPTMLQAVTDGALDPVSAARTLADLHLRLHEVPPLVGEEPGDRILHLDLHPDNVVLTAAGPVVIDWCNTAEGPADLDVAVSALIIAEVTVHPAHAFAPIADAMLGPFLHAVGGAPLDQLGRAVDRRRADRGLTPEEKARLPAAATLVTARA